MITETPDDPYSPKTVITVFRDKIKIEIIAHRFHVQCEDRMVRLGQQAQLWVDSESGKLIQRRGR